MEIAVKVLSAVISIVIVWKVLDDNRDRNYILQNVEGFLICVLLIMVWLL